MQNKKVNYMDITNKILSKDKKEYKVEEQRYFIDNNGNRYDVDGKHVIIKSSVREKEVANILGDIYGGKINLVPVVLNPKGIRTPDYIIGEEKFDLKEIFGNTKNTLDHAIKKKIKQSNNFIFDISKSKIRTNEAIKQIEKIYSNPYRGWIDKIILIKEDKVLKVYKHK